MDSRFELHQTRLEGVMALDRKVIADPRGQLQRLFCAKDLAPGGVSEPIVQINHVLTRRQGTIRGLHYQRPPHSETKIVSCIRGEIYDVVVDLRADSQTFLEFHAEVLSATNHRSILVPKGCAHGFQTLSDDCELLYAHTQYYAPDAEAGLHPEDPRLGIGWPLPVGSMSDRDANHPYIEDAFEGVRL